jgi:hypothetical protein
MTIFSRTGLLFGGEEVGLELVALALELDGAGLEFVGGKLGVGGGGVELDGGGAGAGEVIVLEGEGGGGAGGVDGGAAEVHEGVGGDAAIFGVGDLDAGAGVILEEAAVDLDGGGCVFFGGAGDVDQGEVGEGFAGGGEGDFGDFEGGGGAFDLEEGEAFGGVGDGLEEGVFGVEADEAEFGGVFDDEGGVEGVDAGGEDDLATSGGDGVVDEFLEVGAGEAFGLEAGGEEAEEEEGAHGGKARGPW